MNDRATILAQVRAQPGYANATAMEQGFVEGMALEAAGLPLQEVIAHDYETLRYELLEEQFNELNRKYNALLNR